MDSSWKLAVETVELFIRPEVFEAGMSEAVAVGNSLATWLRFSNMSGEALAAGTTRDEPAASALSLTVCCFPDRHPVKNSERMSKTTHA